MAHNLCAIKPKKIIFRHIVYVARKIEFLGTYYMKGLKVFLTLKKFVSRKKYSFGKKFKAHLMVQNALKWLKRTSGKILKMKLLPKSSF
jgi:hypothetical protein